MDKGTRVRIIKGKGEGQAGSIFWVGENKYGPGKRFGVRGDDGATYWAQESDVEVDGGPAPELPSSDHTYSKGDRVAYQVDGSAAFGRVFWTGESRAGGQRLGLKAETDDETVWLDARYVKPATGEAPERAPERSAERTPQHTSDGAALEQDDEDAIDPAEYAAPLSEAELPPFVDLDDGAVDGWASTLEDEAPPPDDPDA